MSKVYWFHINTEEVLFMVNVRNLNDKKLAEILANEDHPQHDEALDEESYRAIIDSDPRIAQAMGE
jgi:hypothetical protein